MEGDWTWQESYPIVVWAYNAECCAFKKWQEGRIPQQDHTYGDKMADIRANMLSCDFCEVFCDIGGS